MHGADGARRSAAGDETEARAQGDQHRAQTLVRQAGWPRADLESVLLSDLDVATDRLGIQTHLAGDLLLRSAADPQPQDFLHLEHSHLAIRHLPSRLGMAEAEQGGRWPFSPARRGGKVLRNSALQGGNASEKNLRQGSLGFENQHLRQHAVRETPR